MPTHYRVSLLEPNRRLIAVEAHFSTRGRTSLDVELPVWTPGSYLVREYARHLQDFRAETSTGQALVHRRADKCTFRIETAGATEVVARWSVYANDLTVRSSHLDDTHGYFNGATLFLYDAAARTEPHTVEVTAPAGWRVHTALPHEGNHFVARDLDALIDAPFEVGPEEASTFTAAGVPHELVIWGTGNFNRTQMEKDLQAIVEVEAKMMGGLPFNRYVFLLLLSDKLRNGLEHMDSTSLIFPRFGFQPRKSYEEFLTLAAHEYFHLWNVKRIKPKALVPFDYGREAFTELLWAMEGITSYYDTLVVRRANLLSVDRYLERLGELLTALAQTSGRHVQSLAEASTCAWIKYYRPDENSSNSSVSYYLKGEVVGALLDLEIRRATSGAKSLDDVMRLLYARFGDGSGVPEDGIERAAAEVAGTDLSAFFQRAVHAPGELDYRVFESVGLEVRSRPREGTSDKGGTAPAKESNSSPKGYLGAVTKTQHDRLVLSYPHTGSPAMRDGLYAEDELLAIDGFKVEPGEFNTRLEEKAPGTTVELTVFRRDVLRTVRVTLGEKPGDVCWLARRESATEGERKAFESWVGGPYKAELAKA